VPASVITQNPIPNPLPFPPTQFVGSSSIQFAALAVAISGLVSKWQALALAQAQQLSPVGF